MTGPEPPPAAPPPVRPWWVPILGVGSLGLGGVQALGGIGIGVLGMQVPGESAGALLGAGAAWLFPGLLLAASGVAMVAGARRARTLTLAAVAAGALGVVLVAWNRGPLPGALADGMEWVSKRPEAQEALGGALPKVLREQDTLANLRNPELAPIHAWTFSAYCACPVLPWWVLLLWACAGRRGEAIAAKSSRSSP